MKIVSVIQKNIMNVVNIYDWLIKDICYYLNIKTFAQTIS